MNCRLKWLFAIKWTYKLSIPVVEKMDGDFLYTPFLYEEYWDPVHSFFYKNQENRPEARCSYFVVVPQPQNVLNLFLFITCLFFIRTGKIGLRLNVLILL